MNTEIQYKIAYTKLTQQYEITKFHLLLVLVVYINGYIKIRRKMEAWI